MTMESPLERERSGVRGPAFGILVILFAAACLGVGLPLDGGLALRLMDVLGIVAALLAAGRLLVRHDPSAAFGLTVGMAVAALTALAGSPMVFAIRLGLVPIVAWFVYWATGRTRLALLWGATLAGAANGILALAEARLGNDYLAVQQFQVQLAQVIPRDNPELVPLDAGLIRISAQYGTPNELGGILALLIFCGLILATLSSHRRVVAVLTLLAVAGLYVTGSRASYLALFGMLTVLAVRVLRGSRRPVAGKLLVGGLLAVVAFLALAPTVETASSASPSFLSRITTAFTLGGEATTPLRLETWREAAGAISDSPLFGVGLDRVYDVVPATHNSFLFVYLSAGLMGVVAFSAWWLALIVQGVRLVVREGWLDVVVGGAQLMLGALFLVEDRPGSPVFMALAGGLFGFACFRVGRPRNRELLSPLVTVPAGLAR